MGGVLGLGLTLAEGKLPDLELEPDLASEMHLELWMVGIVRPLPLAGRVGEGLLAGLAAADLLAVLAAGDVLAVLAAGTGATRQLQRTPGLAQEYLLTGQQMDWLPP